MSNHEQITPKQYGPGMHEVIWRVRGQSLTRSIGMRDGEAEPERSIAERWGVPVEDVEIVQRGRITLTHRPYERAHGRKARGRARWAFQKSRSEVAFHDDLHGDIVWGPSDATITESRRALEAHGYSGTWAVLP